MKFLSSFRQVCCVTLLIILVFVLYIMYNYVSFHLEVITSSSAKQMNNEIKSVVSKYDKKTTVQKITPDDKNFHWIKTEPGLNLTDRISVFNKGIDKLRHEILQNRGNSEWKPIIAPSPHVLWCNEDNFMTSLNNYDQVKTVVLPWDISSIRNKESPGQVIHEDSHRIHVAGQWSSITDYSNLLIQTYYEWTVSDPLCRYIKTTGFTKARWDAVYNRSCNTNITKTFTPKSVDMVYFYGKPINSRDYWPNNGDSYPQYFYTALPDRVVYMHVIQDAVLTVFGDVHSGNLKLVPYGCSQDTNPEPPADYEKVPIWNEVFMITQFWGDQFFHKMMEILPRISPYIEFLQKNKHIKLHVAEKRGYTRETLKFLGFNPERIIAGTARAKIVYLPQATPCGFAQIQELQLLSKLYQNKIKNFGLGSRNLVILIQRSGLRMFRRKEEIAFIVEKVATEYGLEFILFADNPSPGLEETMHIFYQAVVVVAPHGAGLTNLAYAQPGTFVIEGVCNPPHINMCFQWMSHTLGHRYHGIPSKEGCEGEIVIEPSYIDVVLRMFMEEIKHRGLDSVF